MEKFKKVLSVIGYVGTLIGMYFVGEAVGEFYYNHVFTKTFGVDKI